MKKRTRRVLLVLVIVLVVLVAAAVALVLTDVIHNPWQKEIGEAEAARMAADYVVKHYPEMEGPDVLTNRRELAESWEFAYRMDIPLDGDQGTATIPQIVVVAVHKRTGEIAVMESL